MSKPKNPTKPLNTNSRFRKLTDGWTIEAPTEPLLVVITPEDIKAAKKRDPENCVIAVGLRRSLGPLCRGDIVVTIGNVRATLTFYDQKRVLRYSVPAVLRRGLHVFDQTGKWNLPEGFYCLYPMTESELNPTITVPQTDDVRTVQGVSFFARERAYPTRRIQLSGTAPKLVNKSTKYKSRVTA